MKELGTLTTPRTSLLKREKGKKIRAIKTRHNKGKRAPKVDRRYSPERALFANILTNHDRFVKNLAMELGISFKTFPIESCGPLNEEQEHVSTPTYGFEALTYTFFKEDKRQEITFYLPRERFLEVQDRIADYSGGDVE